MNLRPPDLCHVLTRPLRWLPQRLHTGGLALALNRVLSDQLAQGELDFLRDKTVALEIVDLGVRHRLTLGEGGFGAAPAGTADDVRFHGALHTFLLLATQREDADSLFFRRLLRIEGDTATGLHLKNFIDALDEAPLPPALRHMLERFADLYAQHCIVTGETAQPPQPRPARPLQ